MLDSARIDRLRRGFRGPLVTPSDRDYDAARRVWNAMIDKRPALIARCSGTDDVVAAVRFARDNSLHVAVRGGGHNVAGNATCDDGIVIDLASMKHVAVDASSRIARAAGGVVWGEYDRETQKHGLASPGGAISTTGIAGLTLGGGFGWLSRSWGLACDNLVSAEVVTADGEVLAASADDHADLFWGLRGGGGNFGIVTNFEYRLRPLGELYAGLLLYPRSVASSFLRAYAEMTAHAPDEESSMAAFLCGPDGTPLVGVFYVFRGSAEDGARLLSGLRAIGTPILDDVSKKPYTLVQQAFDEALPPGKRNYWKSNFLSKLDDKCIDTLVAQANRASSPLCIIGIEHMAGGAVARVGSDDTAFAHRDAGYNLLVLGRNDDPAGDSATVAWARETWTAAQPFSTGQVYVNYMTHDEGDRIRQAYSPAHHARLLTLKRKYDPGNLFRLNQNIDPAR